MFIASTLNKHNFILHYDQILLYNKIYVTHHVQWQYGVAINLSARSLCDAIQYQSPARRAQYVIMNQSLLSKFTTSKLYALVWKYS